MDFRRLAKTMPPTSSNTTEPMSFSELSPNILDALIPGYSIISKYAQAVFGIDISLFVTVAVISLAATKGGQYLYNKTWNAFRYFFVSSVYIDEHDDLYDMMMDWLAKTQLSTSRRSVRAKTQRGAKADSEFETVASDALSDEGYFDYNKWSARTPPRYEPYYGKHFLWHDGRLFIFHRSHKTRPGQSLQVSFGQNADDDLIQIDCIGRSVEPIRDLLSAVKAWSLNRLRNKTTIRHPTPKERARFGGAWSKTFSRPSRPIDTVILDQAQKEMIVKDMNEYLHPSTPVWYATRGIPYRRGYLFHGPPGTGKTSLSFALAGIFGLEIYVISLQEPSLTEGDLMQLFNALPRRCIVLLEDVDAAGLIRDGKSDPVENEAAKRLKQRRGGGGKGKADDSKLEQESESQKPKKEEEYTLKDLARELKSIGNAKSSDERPRGGNRQPGTGISLSGLLNAIDGVATHEGRVLIMTTNHPEELDAALVRPGRVDRKVEFGLAMKEQARELFVRMYSGSEEMPTSPILPLNGMSKPMANGSANGHIVEKVPNGRPAEETQLKEKAAPSANSNLEELAAEFAAHVPDDTFTPAEIQNHLMRFKDQPDLAVEKVGEWMEETLVEKNKLKQPQREDDDAEGDDEVAT